MLPLMSVISLAGMVISDLLANSGRPDSPVSDMMAPSMILIFSQSGSPVPRKSSVFFPLLMTVFAIAVSVVRVAMMMAGGCTYQPLPEYLPALLAFIMLVFVWVRAAAKTGSPVIKELHLAIFFALLIVSVYNSMVPGRIPLLLLVGSSALFYLYLYACTVRQSGYSGRIRKRRAAQVRTVPVSRPREEKSDNLDLLYSRLQDLFEEEKPHTWTRISL